MNRDSRLEKVGTPEGLWACETGAGRYCMYVEGEEVLVHTIQAIYASALHRAPQLQICISVVGMIP